MVARFVDLPFYKAHFEDPEKIWYQSVVGAAEKGDLKTDSELADAFGSVLDMYSVRSGKEVMT